MLLKRKTLVPDTPREPWNKGQLIGQKLPLKLPDIWAIRIKLQLDHDIRGLAMFNLAIDSKLRGCDLVALKVVDVKKGVDIQSRATVVQKKTGKPVKFEITKQAREALEKWIAYAHLKQGDVLFPSRQKNSGHLGVRQYARIVKQWVRLGDLEESAYGTHSMRRTKPTILYKKTKNLRAVQLLLGHTKLDSTVRYLGIDEDDALEMSENAEI